MEKFKFITHDIRDAYFNLASEEYLLKHTDGFYFYLWINNPAVIVGVNQNTIEEVNLKHTEAHHVKVVRRLTGGGAVYHDGGNLCYTVIAPYTEGENYYKKFTAPVIEYLNELGVKAEFSGRNDVVINGKKISGNAQTVYNGKIMHHGTLLFNANLDGLKNALIPNKLKMQSKGIKSIRARVTNVKDYLNCDMNIMEFKKGLENKLLQFCEPYEFSESDKSKISALVVDKYSTYEWNVGYSPKSENSFTEKFEFGIIKINFDTKDGCMQNVKISGDFFSKKDVSGLEQKLNGVRFEKNAVLESLENIQEYIQGAEAKGIIDAIFS
ncbi:MAG: lipoate--protein ligase [Clostridia bacterium]|nr:lipoate--protein ligase [Clostridia bacterium]